MSVIKHLQIDVWNADCTGSDDYFEFPANNVPVDPDLEELFQIRLDNDVSGISWVANKVKPRLALFINKPWVLVNLYDPFRTEGRLKV